MNVLFTEKGPSSTSLYPRKFSYGDDKNQTTTVKNVPEIEGFQKIQNEIIELQKAIRFKDTELGTN